MKLKLINVFAVCLITLTILFPSLAVFGMVWGKHLKFVETQQNIHSYNQSIESECSLSGTQPNSLANNDFSNLYIDAHETKLNLFHNYQNRRLWRWLFLLIPFCMVFAICLYDRYLVYRAHIHQQQVEMLEKLWQQSLEK
ncbi:MAG: hypothetical protein HC836_24550 [Richelia sp. RM2_1_2]|nr:hypothetical protein [Richelia sp. SM2_1_7]NJM18548.1 hypothetical protein [Richelia sp. SM1_7_0]NJN07682.1 hypothetical protein [Richelia sp. RM1_1_1]NJO31348.1 hypothetical protein [Richelia sp. SL_2_1]NJO61306.1 hypothetical protein [Richelia sp. RM2_1_2]